MIVYRYPTSFELRTVTELSVLTLLSPYCLQAQLAMVELALAADPANSELAQLKEDLATLIQLTQETLHQDQVRVLYNAHRKPVIGTCSYQMVLYFEWEMKSEIMPIRGILLKIRRDGNLQ